MSSAHQTQNVMLQDSLGGNCRTAFIATVSPSVLSLEETSSTLKFADRAKRVVSHAVVNEQLTQQVISTSVCAFPLVRSVHLGPNCATGAQGRTINSSQRAHNVSK